MKRFTETTKWSDPWFHKLKPTVKLLWFYLCENCDAAGVIDLDLRIASFTTGARLTESEVEALGERIELLPDGKFWLPKFIPFQYGKLSTECKGHKPVFAALEKSGLKERVLKDIPKGIHTLQDRTGQDSIVLIARELYPPELQTDAFIAAWGKWVQHLRERGKGMGDVQRDSVWRECVGAGAARSVQIIEACIKAGYKRLCWDMKLDTPSVVPAAKRIPNYKTQLERDLDALQNGN